MDLTRYEQEVLEQTHMVLLAARALIMNPKRWTQQSCARDDSGHSVAYKSDEATKWCSWGALQRCGDEGGMALSVLNQASGDLFCESPITVNDWREHEDVILMFDRAIILIEKGLSEVFV